MTTRAHEGRADLWIAGVVLALLIIIAVLHPEPMPAKTIVPPASSDVTVLQPGPDGQPILRYEAADQRVVITEHAPRTLLLCVHGKCDLLEAWRAK